MEKYNFEDQIIKTILDRYDLGEMQRFSRLQGWSTTPYSIETSAGKYILKFYDSIYKGEQEVSELIKIIRFLSTKNLPTQNIQKTRNGDYCIEVYFLGVKKYAIVYDFIEGEHLRFNLMKSEHFYELGHNLKSINEQLAKYEIDNTHWARGDIFFEKDLNRYVDSLAHNLYHNHLGLPDKKVRYLLSNWERDQSKLTGLIGLLKNKREQLIHADVTVDNVLFKKNKVSGIIDFDWMRIGYAEDDIAITLGAWILNGTDISIEKCINKFFDGYQVDVDDQDRINLIFAFIHFYVWREIKWALDYVDDDQIETRNRGALRKFVTRYNELCSLSLNRFHS